MKVLIGFVVLLLSFAASLTATDKALQLVDQSKSDSPIENVGTTTLQEDRIETSVFSVTHREDWTAKNRSPKEIVAIVETLQISDANRSIVQRKAEYDAVFHPETLEPGKTISFSQDTYPATAIKAGTSPSESATATVVVRWVQFLDGSSFGDPQYADDLLRNRAAILSALQKLSSIYRSEGLESFSQELQKKISPPVADAYLGHIRGVLDKRGSQAAADALETHLETAQKRLPLFVMPTAPQ